MYIHGRNADKLQRVIAEIKELSTNNNINGFVADFTDLAAVRQMAQQINAELPQLDALVNNAGVYNSSISHNKDGYDIRFVVNFFAPYLLTNSLTPLLQKGNKARIINLSSAAQASVMLNVLTGETKVSAQDAYAQSKLALTMWSFYLTNKLQDTNVIAVNPGSLLNTNMVKEAFGKFWSPAEKGGNIIYDLAVSDEYKNVTGKYFDNDKGNPIGTFGEAHPDAYDDAKIERLIKETSVILEAKQ